jgi:hypothetical protein
MPVQPMREGGGRTDGAQSSPGLDEQIRLQQVKGGTTRPALGLGAQSQSAQTGDVVAIYLPSYERLLNAGARTPEGVVKAGISEGFFSQFVDLAESGRQIGRIDIQIKGERDKPLEDAIGGEFKAHFQRKARGRRRNALIIGASAAAAAAAYAVPTVASLAFGYVEPAAVLVGKVASGFAMFPLGYFARESHLEGNRLSALSAAEIRFSSPKDSAD